MKKKSVGLVLLVDMPGEDGGLRALLQRRGRFNFEEGTPESRPGGCQVTAHGKLEEGEDFMKALLREVAEELGTAAALLISGRASELVGVVHQQEGEGKEEAVTFALKVDSSFVHFIRLGPSTGGFHLVSRAGLGDIQNLRDFDKIDGVQDTYVIAMFPDEQEAVIKAFARFS